jgi:hypothetical protein
VPSVLHGFRLPNGPACESNAGTDRYGCDQQQPLPGPQAPESARSPVKGARPFVVRGSRKAGVLQSNSAASDSGGSFAARSPVKQPV